MTVLPPTDRRRLLVIHNPVAGARRARRLAAVIAALGERHGAEVTVWATTRRGDAEAMGRSLTPASGWDAVAVAGGDGTINEAINGIMAGNAAAPWAPPPFAVVPLGTANVLAHELGLPFDAAGVADTLALGRVQPVHLGTANGRCFAMMAGVGLDAHVVDGVDPALKRRIGKGAYALETLRRLARPRGGRYRVTVGNTVHEVAAAIAANGHFYGGTFVCAPDARLAEPTLHLCRFERFGRWNALRYVAGVTTGLVRRFPDVPVAPVTALRIDGPAGEPVQGDGDIIARLPVDIGLHPRTLPVLVPAG
ncbi:YegS/Rv2252/BmrU family lipid kinase [Azospirillum fermentarium]|uniref:diacylglycerol/lipid kinase family protein n=1 Tax=Azospirillum fermentarium TaxID=1233114 RepID=UPI002225E82B|nr:diacylglycerol kinase family protein [Azospirillum fermentarium]MCW2245409.1 YegS/Rv2252/BmrU family lipid kinase [Azospirillum fermentarium]